LQPHIKYRTSPQEHEFGWPYQLGLHTNHEPADAPEECQLASIRALPGDIVIVGSDGLFDNLFDRDIYAIVMKHHNTSRSPAPLVRELMEAAYTNSLSRRAVTPYSFGASEWFDMVYNGGKPDDISIVAAYLS
jgi:protein phosphatase PTC7